MYVAYKVFLIFIFLLIPSRVIMTQNGCVPNINSNPVDAYKKAGEQIVISWDTLTSPNLAYVRIRRSQAISGLFPVWVTVYPPQTSYTFTTTTSGYYYFATAWYKSIDANGVVTISESVGSNMCRLHIVK